MKEKVTFAHLHQRTFIPGLNKHVEKGLDQKTYPGIQMETHEAGLLISYQGHNVIMPYVNFQALVLTESEAVKNTMSENKKAAKKEFPKKDE